MADNDEFDARSEAAVHQFSASKRTSTGNGSGGFPVSFAVDVKAVLECHDFIEGLLLDGAMSVIYGESNSGKTFFGTDLAFHVAAGMTYCGREVEQGAVIYCALEGAYGIFNRVAALKLHYGYKDAPLAIVPVAINMLDPNQDIGRLLQTIEYVRKTLGLRVRQVVMDTLSRAMAGGNENSPDDMGTLVMNSTRVQQETGAHVSWIHHCGKDTAKGARGHSLLLAATDTEIEIYAGEGKHVARVTKQRELECTGEFVFDLQVIELGTNRRGKLVTSCVVRHANAGTTAPQRTVGKNGLSEAAMIGVRALEIALSRVGALLPNGPDWPSGVPAVTIEQWRKEYYSLKGGEADTQRQAFHRAQVSLLAKNRITQRDDLVWFVKSTLG